MIIEALQWQDATVTAIHDESSRAKTFRLEVTEPYSFVAGQHTIVRVTLSNGFKSSRDYSFSSAPSSGVLEITVAKEPQGEVSNWFYNKCQVGERIEMTQPISNDFLWTPEIATTPLLIAGGIGVTPFMSMLRENRLQGSPARLHLLYSVKKLDEMCFTDELLGASYTTEVTPLLTQIVPPDWQGLRGRVDAETLSPLVETADLIYLCGSYAFVTETKQLLGSLGIDDSRIKTEKFN